MKKLKYLIIAAPVATLLSCASNTTTAVDKSGIDLTNASGPVWHQLFLKAGGRSLPADNTAVIIRASGYKIKYVWSKEDSSALTPNNFVNYSATQEEILAYLASRFATVKVVTASDVYFAFGNNVHGITVGNMPTVSLEGAPESVAYLI